MIIRIIIMLFCTRQGANICCSAYIYFKIEEKIISIFFMFFKTNLFI